MKRIGSWLPLLGLFVALLIAQGVMIVWGFPGSGGRSDSSAWRWSEIVRDEGPIMERIPAPYVVLTILGCAAIAMIVWSLLVRWTDIDEAI